MTMAKKNLVFDLTNVKTDLADKDPDKNKRQSKVLGGKMARTPPTVRLNFLSNFKTPHYVLKNKEPFTSLSHLLDLKE